MKRTMFEYVFVCGRKGIGGSELGFRHVEFEAHLRQLGQMAGRQTYVGTALEPAVALDRNYKFMNYLYKDGNQNHGYDFTPRELRIKEGPKPRIEESRHLMAW